MSDPIYVIGDTHGQTAFLDQALDWIAADGGPDAQIVFLGDFEDRGPDSRGVIARVMEGMAEGRPWRAVKGNHDRMFTRYLDDGTVTDSRISNKSLDWLHPRLGGAATLASYGVPEADTRPRDEVLADARTAVPAAHRAFLQSLPTHIEAGDLLFVHAGILPGSPLDQQTEDDLIWIRDPFLLDTRQHPWLVVHGHTAIDLPFHYGNRVNLDGGAGYGRPIHPVVFEGTDAWLLDQSGRLMLTP